MKTSKVSAWLAFVVGVLTLGELLDRPLRHPQWWPFVIFDLIPAALLFGGAAAVLRGGVGRWLAAGWGFSTAATYNSLFIHAEALLPATPGHARERVLCAILAGLLMLDVGGLALAVWSPGRPSDRLHLGEGGRLRR
jgi:hypothetical protein